jgi:drug/metabolite transporter (DMT)-like permease
MVAEAKSATRAAMWMLGALMSFSAMAIAGREAGHVLSTVDILIWRSLLGIPIMTAAVALNPAGFRQLRTARPLLHIVRNIFHFAGQYCWFFALVLIPLAQLFALEFTSPIWVAILAAVILGERVTIWKVIAIAFGFAGVLIVAQPGTSAFEIGHASALLAAFFFAIQMICTKKLTESDSVVCILFFMTVMQTLIGLVVGGGLPAIPSDAGTTLWVIVLAVGSLCAHFCLTRAFTYADASIVVPMDFFRLPLIALVGVAFYAEPLEFLIIAGGALIFLGNFINIWGSARAERS